MPRRQKDPVAVGPPPVLTPGPLEGAGGGGAPQLYANLTDAALAKAATDRMLDRLASESAS